MSAGVAEQEAIAGMVEVGETATGVWEWDSLSQRVAMTAWRGAAGG